jgi:microcin C transport system substrate-binding protein
MTYFINTIILILISWSTPVYSKNKPACYNLISLDNAHIENASLKPAPYVNISAPKAGALRQGIITRFNSLNPFVLKGIAPSELFIIYESLFQSTENSIQMQAHIAKCVEISDDQRSISFLLNPKAKWHDGHPIVAKDIQFTIETLRQQGHPFYASLLGFIDHIEVLSPEKVMIHSKNNLSTEQIFSVARLSLLPSHFWASKSFEKSTNIVPLGSGPYRLSSYQMGKSLEFKRVADHWAANEPSNIGRYNFKRLDYQYYSDPNTLRQALFSNDIDLNQENLSKAWATQYLPNKTKNMNINTRCVLNQQPRSLQAFQLNLRNPLFKNLILRKTLSDAFDFNWSNKQLFYGQYTRSNSFFDNTNFNGQLPFSDFESSLLTSQPPLTHLPPYQFKSYANKEELVETLREDLSLLLKEGYTLNEQQLFTPGGQPVKFTILIYSDAFERILLPLINHLKRIGIQAKIKKVIPSQFIRLLRDHQFDIFINTFSNDGWPISEVGFYWGSQYAKKSNTSNHSGLEDPLVDWLIDKINQSKKPSEYAAYLKAMDRYLLNQYIVIPQWHIANERIASTEHIVFPKNMSKNGLDLHSLWFGQQIVPHMQNCTSDMAKNN